MQRQRVLLRTVNGFLPFFCCDRAVAADTNIGSQLCLTAIGLRFYLSIEAGFVFDDLVRGDLELAHRFRRQFGITSGKMRIEQLQAFSQRGVGSSREFIQADMKAQALRLDR